MTINEKLEDWNKITCIVKKIKQTRLKEQISYIERYMCAAENYQTKHKEHYNPNKKPMEGKK